MNAPVNLLGMESRVRLPDPQEILDVGYSIHAADDPVLKETTAQETARAIVQRFMSIEGKDEIESAYLACARGIAFAFGRAIARRKLKYEQDRDAANSERARMLEQLRESRSQGAYLSVAYRLLAPAIMLLSGYFTARFIGMFIPVEVNDQVGSKLPGVILALAFVFVGRAAMQWLYDRKRGFVESQYHRATSLANETYEYGKLAEYGQYRQRLCGAWKQYAGEDYPERASYEFVMRGDIETRLKFDRERQISDRTVLWMLRRVARLLRGKKRNGDANER